MRLTVDRDDARHFAEEVEREVHGLLREEMNHFASDLFAWIAVNTPYDTGRAQNSWAFAVGNVDETDVPPEGDYPEVEHITAAVQAQAYLSQDRSRDLDRTVLSSLWYMEPLTHGHSSSGYALREAPADWFWAALDEEVRRFEERQNVG